MRRPCDVIGCPYPAEWHRSPTSHTNHHEEYLCEWHYADLAQNRPWTAAEYERLSEEEDTPPTQTPEPP